MDTFCDSMYKTKVFLNEKGVNSFSIDDMIDNEDYGLVALDTQAIRDEIVNKKASCNKEKIVEIFNNIYMKIIILDEKKQKIYTKYLLKEIFKIRDIHEGNGERDIFYILIMELYKYQPLVVEHSLIYLVGGYDLNNNNDIFKEAPPGSFLDLNKIYLRCFKEKEKNHIYMNLMLFIIDLYKNTLLLDDFKNNDNYPSLACKWIPRENSSYNKKCFITNNIVKALYKDDSFENFKKFRKLVSRLSKNVDILEQLMCSNNWTKIEIKKIPSKAFIKYMKALHYIDKEGNIRLPLDIDRMSLRERVLREMKLAKTNPEKSVINTKTLMPYEIVKHIMCGGSETNIEHYNSLWSKFMYDFKNNLENCNLKNGLCIADVSASMSGRPLEACISLSILLSSLLKGPLHNKIITFSQEPEWHRIPEGDLYSQVCSLMNASWDSSTNFGKVLDLILNTAINNNLKQEELPDVLYVFSDMQWDQACLPLSMTYSFYKTKTEDKFLTGYESIKLAYEEAGYKVPHIVFWNLRQTDNYNNKSDQKGTTMMSGFSSNMFKSFLDGKFILENTPWDTLKDILNSERYVYLDNIIKEYYI
tara:strand:+ start:1074 stop:2834 length:1761 start_codon:yes stop_codon:yes gene_type:complete